MKKIKYLLILLCIINTVLLQAQNKNTYFQQQVKYDIDVTLNDTLNTLTAYETIEYTNNSKDTLHQLFFHIWANAYKNDRTAFCKQKVELGDTKFYFSKPEDKGYIKNLNFKINDSKADYSEYNNNADIIIINLPEALLPKKSITITTPFTVKIPKLFSRMGQSHKQDFQISQWYPKPAVYDVNGWHPMPYLDQGEFFSEYGNYTVNITLPKNYVVVATGDLQTPSEINFINDKIEFSKNLDSASLFKLKFKKIESIYENKTITFKQDSVHDFAWFADKRFLIEKSEQLLPSGKKVNSFIYYLPKNKSIWSGQCKNINYTLQYLSNHVGEYKYNHASAVDGGLLAGSGMEYPNVTVIGKIQTRKLLQQVIVHEIGHNWFQGMLGSNERDYPYMDEGINSFYENTITDSLNKKEKINNSWKNIIENPTTIYKLLAKYNLDQGINLPSENYSSINYGICVYGKTAIVFKNLQSYLGNTTFENCMKKYFQNFSCKHPYPADLQQVFEENSNKNLNWFFKDVLSTTKKTDVKIQKVCFTNNSSSITLKNKTHLPTPIEIKCYQKDSLTFSTWTEPFAKTKSIAIPSNFDRIEIENSSNSLDVNRSNNEYASKSLLHYNLGLGFGLQDSKKQIMAIPAFGYNHYDGEMAGILVHNISIRTTPFEYILAPMYGFNSKTFVGIGNIAYTIYPTSIFSKIKLFTNASLFHNDESNLNIPATIFSHYVKVVPNIECSFKQKSVITTKSDVFTFSDFIISENKYNYTITTPDTFYKSSLSNSSTKQIFVLNFKHSNFRTFNPFNYNYNLQANNLFIKMGITGNITMHYNKPNKALYLRAFAGKFFNLASNPYDSYTYNLATTYNAANDYLYQNYYVARNINDNFLQQQISEQEGGLKLNTNKLSNRLGISNNWLLALNAKTDLPIDLPIKVRAFVDVCTAMNNSSVANPVRENFMDGGLQISVLKNIFGSKFTINNE